jgi:pimeloyl-ACP methyl ester carboxylesterase
LLSFAAALTTPRISTMNRPDPNGPDTIVFIHGLWMTPLSWEKWTSHYTKLGYKVVARGWPGLDGDIDEIRRNPERIAGLGITEIVEHYESIINELDRVPIIMGHSFGGLITQILLDRGLGAAGVAISTAPVKGVLLLPFSTLKVSFPALSNPLNNHRAVPLTAEQFHYAFGNTLSEEESLKVFQRYAVPGPDHVLFQAGLANFNPHAVTTVDFHNDTRAPLLLIAGDKDHIAPPSVVKATYKLYHSKSKALTDYKEFEGRSHYILGQNGWEEVADYALDWAAKNARQAVTA